jgi:hypothetical protein
MKTRKTQTTTSFSNRQPPGWARVMGRLGPVVALSAILAAGAQPAWAALTPYTFTFDEYYISDSTTFDSIFPERKGLGYKGPGIYQETRDAAHGKVRVTRLATTDIPGEYVKNTTPNKNELLTIFGWSQSLANGQQVAEVYNSGSPENGSVLYFRYTAGGVQNTPFTFNSFDLRGASPNASVGFTLNGYLNGVQEYSSILNVTGNKFSTFTLNWQNIDTVEIDSTASLPVNWGSGTLYMGNVRLNSQVPEPSIATLLPFGASVLWLLRKRRAA